MGFIMRAEKDYVVTRSEVLIFFFKQETAYEMRISDWSSDVCSSDLFQLKQHLWRIPPGVNLLQPQGRCRIWTAPGVDMDHGGNRHVQLRTAERRVGKACVSTCRSRRSPTHQQKHTHHNNHPLHTPSHTHPSPHPHHPSPPHPL